MWARNPYLDETLGIKRGCLPRGCEYATAPYLDPTDALVTGSGHLHFSIPTTLAEEAAWWAVGEAHAVPASVHVSLHAAAKARGRIMSMGTVLRRGNRIFHARGETWQEGRLLCTVEVTFTKLDAQGKGW